MNLTLNFYTQWYWKIDLYNLLHFLELRLDSHAQYGIRKYALAIAEVVKEWVPLTWEAFSDYRRESLHLSRGETQALKVLVAGKVLT